MTHMKRPIQISSILKTLGTGTSPEISDELEKYITDLEARQPLRPEGIVTLLKTIGSQLSAEKARSLEAYISDLEARQKVILSENDQTPIDAPDNLPIWSYQRQADRAQHRRERDLRRRNNYQ